MNIHLGGPQIAFMLIEIVAGLLLVVFDRSHPAVKSGRLVGIALTLVLLYCGGFFSGARP